MSRKTSKAETVLMEFGVGCDSIPLCGLDFDFNIFVDFSGCAPSLTWVASPGHVLIAPPGHEIVLRIDDRLLKIIRRRVK